ncbi:transposase [Pseudogracilibacillus sp. SO30301A]|uniref:transposase n=1 Tax=Pseudogracilibacillus sp. SO30301A TaxID=3098291 RepID=UPI00300E26D0
MKPYQRITEIGHEALLYTTSDRTFKAVGEAFDRSGQNVRIHVLKYYSEQSDLAERSTPPLIGMDEISLAKGKGNYRLVMYDLTIPWRPQLFLMHESRREDEVIKLLQELPQPERMLAVAIAMWRGYKTAVQAVLPEAIVVIDAFHVIQASTKAVGDVRKDVQKSLSKEQRDALKRDKEEKTALLKWRKYQDRYERRLKQNESQTAC